MPQKNGMDTDGSDSTRRESAMYAYITGTVAEVTEETVVIDNHGIGYRIFVPAGVADSVSVGSEERLYTFFSVREDAMQLFGFLSKDDLEMFRLLLGVSGIGPRGALGILSVLNADDLAPGIGKKTAQKVILELKDKLDLADAFEKKQEHAQQGSVKETGTESEAVMALTALGYSNSEAFRAVRSAEEKEPGTDTEGLIRLALKELYR